MNKDQLVRDLSARFADRKPAFLADVKLSVASYIEGQKSGCLTLIERIPGQDRLWKVAANIAYVARLIAFCREKPYEGHAIDSALTDPVVGIVTQRFEQLYQDGSDEIATAVLQFIVNDKVLSEALVSAVVDSAGYAGAAMRNRAASFLLDHVRHFLHTTAGHAVTNFVGKTVAATAAKPVGMYIAGLLVKALTLHTKALIAKVLATGALKGIIATAVKKFVFFAVAGAVVKAVAAKFGISTMAAFMWILIPVVVAYLAYEAMTFPKHLAEKVSAKVVEDLSDKYDEVNDEVFAAIVSQIVGTGIAVIVQPVAESPEVQAALRELFKDLSQVS